MRTHYPIIIVAFMIVLVVGFTGAADLITHETFALEGCTNGCDSPNTEAGVVDAADVITNSAIPLEEYLVRNPAGTNTGLVPIPTLSGGLPAPYFPVGPDHGLHVVKTYTPTGLLTSYLAGVDVTNGGDAGYVYYTISGDYFSQKSVIFWMEAGQTVTVWAELCDAVGCTVPVQQVYVNVRLYHPEWGDANVGSFIITPTPNYGFFGTPLSGFAPLNVSFTAIFDGTSYLWDFGDGNASTLRNPTHTYQNPGSYSVLLVVVNGGVPYIFTRSNYISVIPRPSITVVVPNGGEDWPEGVTHMIRWNYTGNPGSTVRIEALRNETYVGTVTAGTSIGSGGSGSFSLVIPPGFPLGSDYKIRVTSTSNATFTDTSDAPFTISGVPTITVASPNGGEDWVQGSLQTISWTYTGNPGPTVRIEALQGTTLLGVITPGVAIGSGGSGSYSLTVPFSTPPGTGFRIRVTSTSYPDCTDTSDAPFTISPAITVAFPNGGETWVQGSLQTISWNYISTPGPSVKIEALRGTTLLGVITPGSSIGSGGSGSYSLTVPYTISPGTDFRIRVTSTTYPACTDTSNAPFTISPAITVTSPNGGDNWVRGSLQTISWSYTGDPGSTVKIEALRGSTVVAVITPGTSFGSGGSGSYSLTVPFSTPLGTDYRIRVTSTTYPACTDASDAPFTVSAL